MMEGSGSPSPRARTPEECFLPCMARHAYWDFVGTAPPRELARPAPRAPGMQLEHLFDLLADSRRTSPPARPAQAAP